MVDNRMGCMQAMAECNRERESLHRIQYIVLVDGLLRVYVLLFNQIPLQTTQRPSVVFRHKPPVIMYVHMLRNFPMHVQGYDCGMQQGYCMQKYPTYSHHYTINTFVLKSFHPANYNM